MPNRNKSRQKSDQLELVDTFVNDWVNENGLPVNPGLSETERTCAKQANKARDAFKEIRNRSAISSLISSQAQQPTSPNDTEDSMGSGASASSDHSSTHQKKASLSAAQKYNIRLNNNRRSSHATKVFNEVYRREMSTALQNFETQQKIIKQYAGATGLEYQVPSAIAVKAAVLQKENTELGQQLAIYKMRLQELASEVEAFRAAARVKVEFPRQQEQKRSTGPEQRGIEREENSQVEQNGAKNQGYPNFVVQAPGANVDYIVTPNNQQFQHQYDQQKQQYHNPCGQHQQNIQRQPGQTHEQHSDQMMRNEEEGRTLLAQSESIEVIRHPEHPEQQEVSQEQQQQNVPTVETNLTYREDMFDSADYFASSQHPAPPA